MATTRANTQPNPLDQFYTRPKTAAACIAHLDAVLPNLAPDLYLEPSAGDGAFLWQLPHPRLGIDIAPADLEIAAADFLAWVPDENLDSIAVVGNPPFGRNAALAVRFFNHAANFADVIAMIMPASLMKGSMQNRLDARFELVSELALPAEPFRVDGQLHQVNAVFQVWKRSDILRPKATATTTHADFTFVKTVDEADFVVRRVGGRAGAIMAVPATGQALSGYAPASNLFIKARGVDPTRLETRFRALDFSDVRCCVAAHPSVSKGEIVTLYDALLKLDAITQSERDTRHSNIIHAALPACPILPVRELHGRTLRQHLAEMLSTPETAQPGDIVAVRCSGLGFDTSWMTAATTFLVKTRTGISERYLYELADDQKIEAAICIGLVANNGEVVQAFPKACHCPDESSPRRFELIHCRNALLLLWLEEYRQFADPPVLLKDVEVPAALFITEEDLVGSIALPAHRLIGIKSLAECAGFLQIADPPVAAYP